MDDDLRAFIEEKWGIYEQALAIKDKETLSRYQHTMALIRTMASVMALGMSVLIAYKVW